MVAASIITHDVKLKKKAKFLLSIGGAGLVIVYVLSRLDDFGTIALSTAPEWIEIPFLVLLFLPLVFGGILYNVAEGRTTEMGTMIMEENLTTITLPEKTIVYENERVRAHFSETGVRGETDTIQYLKGRLSINSGINTITFFDADNKLPFDVLIETREQYAAIIDTIKERFWH